MRLLLDSLGDHVEKIKTWNPRQSGQDKEFSYIDLSSVDKENKIIDLVQVQEVLPFDSPSRARQLVKTSDILVSTVRPNLNGVASVPDKLNDATASTGYCVLRPNKQTLNSNYLFYWVQSNLFINDMISKASGANYPAVSDKIIKQSKIPLPPLPEQQKIAAILDAADKLRQKDQQLIEKYNVLSQSLFLDMFGDPVGNPKNWDKEPLQDLVKSVIDCPHSTPRWIESGKVAIRTSNLTCGGWSWADKRFISAEEFHERSKRGYVNTGDIILSREGTIGVLAIVSKGMEICLGQRLVQLIPNHSLANNYYLLHLLLYELKPARISRVMVGATSKHLNVKELRAMKLPNPPITLQNQFAERIQAIEAQKQQAQASLQKSEDLFNSLLQRAFKGELT